MGNVFAVDLDAAAGRAFQQVNQPYQGGFASAGMADYAKYFAGFNSKAGGVQRRNSFTPHLVGFLYLVKYDHESALSRLGRQCFVGANLKRRDYKPFAHQTRIRTPCAASKVRKIGDKFKICPRFGFIKSRTVESRVESDLLEPRLASLRWAPD